MIDDTVYKIAIAAYLHDIGKFAERADMPLDRKSIDINQSLFQPQYHGKYTHKHALYTAGFIEKYQQYIPDALQTMTGRDDESMLMLAARHHNPSSPLDWIITIADRVSSGFDRDKFEDPDAKEIEISEYRKT